VVEPARQIGRATAGSGAVIRGADPEAGHLIPWSLVPPDAPAAVMRPGAATRARLGTRCLSVVQSVSAGFGNRGLAS